MALGAIYGLLGVGFVSMNVKITTWRHKYIPATQPTKRTLEVMFVALVTVSIAYWLCWISPCAPIPEHAQYFKSSADTVRKYVSCLFCAVFGQVLLWLI